MNRDDLAKREEDVAFIRRSIDDLDNERAAGDLTEDDYGQLRSRYVARLNAFQQEVIEGKAALPARKPRNRAKSLGWAAVVGVVAIGAGLFVARSAGQRLPTDTITGGNVRDADQLLIEARSALGTNRGAALARFQQVLEVQPDNAEAITYSAWITRLDTKAAVDAGTLDPTKARGTFERVDSEFDRAAAKQASYADPRCFQAVLRFRDLADASRAHAAYATCLSSNPNQTVAGLVSKIGPEIDAALGASADPVVAGLARARVALAGGKIIDAVKLYDGVAKADPTSAEARTWSVWLQAKILFTGIDAGQISVDLAKTRLAKAEAEIDAVRAATPTFADAACVKAVLAVNRQDADAAAVALPACRVGVATPEMRDAAVRLTAAPPPTTKP